MVKLNLIVLEKWSESWIYAINTYSSTFDGSTPPPLWKLFSLHWNVHGYHARKTILSIYVTVRGQLPCIFVELPKYCLYDMKHQSSNQSIICPPNVDSTMWLILAGTPYTLKCNVLRSVMLRGIKSITIRIYHNVRFKVNLFERLRTIHMMSSHKSQWRMRIVD